MLKIIDKLHTKRNARRVKKPDIIAQNPFASSFHQLIKQIIVPAPHQPITSPRPLKIINIHPNRIPSTDIDNICSSIAKPNSSIFF